MRKTSKCLRLRKRSSLMINGWGISHSKAGLQSKPAAWAYWRTPMNSSIQSLDPRCRKEDSPSNYIAEHHPRIFVLLAFYYEAFFSHEKKSIMLNHAWSPWAIGPRPRIWTPTQPMRVRGPCGVPAHPSPFQLNHPSGKDWTFRKQRNPLHP